MDASLKTVGLQMGVEVLRKSLEQQEQLALQLINSTVQSSTSDAASPAKVTQVSSADSSSEGHIDIRV